MVHGAPAARPYTRLKQIASLSQFVMPAAPRLAANVAREHYTGGCMTCRRHFPTLACCFLLACGAAGGDEHAVASLQFDADTYERPHIEARVVAGPDYHDLRLLASVDPYAGTGLQDGRLFVRVDARISLAISGAELHVFGVSRLSVDSNRNSYGLEKPLDCAAVDAAQWAPSLVEHVCFNVFRDVNGGGDVITQRVGGSITLQTVDERHMRGRLQLWAVGLASEKSDPEELAFNPLFAPSVSIDVPFDAEITP
jgi:hypothetical protein